MAGDRAAIIWWGVPLTILAGIATHLTSRRSVARQREMNIDASGPQTAIMNKLMLYMFPLFVVFGGPFFPLAILFYWLANNSWTFGQLQRRAHPAGPEEARRGAGRRRGQGRLQVLHPEAGRQAQDDRLRPAGDRAVQDRRQQRVGRANGRREWRTERRSIRQRWAEVDEDSPAAAGGRSRPVTKPVGTKPAPGARPQQNKTKKKNTQR